MKKLAVSVLLALSLSACVSITNNGIPTGNTGSMGDNDTIVTQFPVETALLNIYTQPRSETLYATDSTFNSHQKIVANIVVTPKGAMRFDGKSLQAAETAYLTTVDGSVMSQSASLNYFTLDPARFYGFTNSSGDYSIATQTATMPKMAQAGQSSPLITENVYSDSSKRQQIRKFTQSWSLSQASTNSAWFCLDTSENLLLNNEHNSSSTHCYKINAKGDILDSKLTIKQPTDEGVKIISYTRKPF